MTALVSRLRDRRAMHLLEILIAALLAAGPMLIAFELVQANSRASRFNHDRATARMILLDLVTLLQGEGLDGVKGRMAGDRLSDLLSERIVLMPDPAREPYLEQARRVLGRIRGRLEEDVDPARPGLARLVLQAKLPDGATVQVSALFRPKARERLRIDPEPSCQTSGGQPGGD